MVGRILYLGQFIMNLVSRIVHFLIEMLNGGVEPPIYGGKFILCVGTTNNSFIVQDAFSERKAKFPVCITHRS